MKKLNDNNKLAVQMLVAMIAGIVAGLIFMAVRESAGEWTSFRHAGHPPHRSP